MLYIKRSINHRRQRPWTREYLSLRLGTAILGLLIALCIMDNPNNVFNGWRQQTGGAAPPDYDYARYSDGKTEAETSTQASQQVPSSRSDLSVPTLLSTANTPNQSPPGVVVTNSTVHFFGLNSFSAPSTSKCPLCGQTPTPSTPPSGLPFPNQQTSGGLSNTANSEFWPNDMFNPPMKKGETWFPTRK